MSQSSNAIPIIIRRHRGGEHDDHHGGAWKVAYADFVTAMMAFFLLMWLLNATTDSQRKGIADYFNPDIPISRTSGGADGALGGDTAQSEQTMAQSHKGASAQHPTDERQAAGSRDSDSAAEQRALAELKAELHALGGESPEIARLMKHVVTRLTDEGLVVEIFDLDDSPLFETGGTTPNPVIRDLVRVVTRVFSKAKNPLAVHGHVRSHPIVMIENPTWDLSTGRAQTVRGLLQSQGIGAERIERVSGFADRVPIIPDPMGARNNRIEIVLLRQSRLSLLAGN